MIRVDEKEKEGVIIKSEILITPSFFLPCG